MPDLTKVLCQVVISGAPVLGQLVSEKGTARINALKRENERVTGKYEDLKKKQEDWERKKRQYKRRLEHTDNLLAESDKTVEELGALLIDGGRS